MRIQAICSGDEDRFWFKASVNGSEIGKSVPVDSIEAFRAIESRLNEMLAAVYLKGKYDGIEQTRLSIRAAIGC